MSKTEKYIRTVGVVLCEAFAFITVILMLSGGQYGKLLLAAVTPFIILMPKAAERIFKRKFPLPIYLFGIFYAIGPMLGHCHNLYYTVPWWDKMLHIMGGVMFAFVGLLLFEKFIGRDKKNAVISAVFVLCFSMSISVLWEFCEFGADTFLGMDMQDDTVVTHINSYLLDERPGFADSIDNIEEVTVNGQPLPVEGYIDIGLTDTMLDMLLETAGSVVFLAALPLYRLAEKRFAAKS